MTEFIGQVDVGIMHQVGDESVAVITRLNPTETDAGYVGNVLRRTCAALGEGACTQGCALRDSLEDRRDYDKRCADSNLAEAFNTLGIAAEKVVMVGVTANEVGFGDELESYRQQGKLVSNPDGWQELPGYNAFFARPEEIPAIGSRLADCAHIEFELKDSSGNTVIGFEHGSRPNMHGPSKYEFELDGRPVSYTEYVLSRALQHYGADPASVHIRLSSSIRAENFVKRFESEEKLESHIPGWQAAGYATNLTNPGWEPGMPTTDADGQPDVWYADACGMIMRDITVAMETLGVPAEQFNSDTMLDPADTGGEYSSHENRNEYGDTRDLYLIAHHTAFDT